VSLRIFTALAHIENIRSETNDKFTDLLVTSLLLFTELDKNVGMLLLKHLFGHIAETLLRENDQSNRVLDGVHTSKLVGDILGGHVDSIVILVRDIPRVYK
jgi:hypothetical protein